MRPSTRRVCFSVLLCGGLSVLGSGASAQEVSEEARQHFVAGVTLLQDPAKPRYEEAYREFRTAYAMSSSYKILANLALCEMMLERDAEAINSYEKYLAQATSLDPLEKAQVERDLLTLKVGVVRLDVKVLPKGATLIDQRIPTQGEPVTNVYGPVDDTIKLGVRQGHHILRAKLEGRVDATWEFEAPGGTSKSYTFELKEPVVASPTPSGPTTITTRPLTGATLGAGIGTAALGVAAVLTGVFALDAQSRYTKRNDGSDPDGASSLRSTGQTLNVTTDVLLGATVLGAAVTTYLFLTRPSVIKREATAPLTFRF